MHKIFKTSGLIGKKALFLPACHSTNEVAASFLTEKDGHHGTVVYTDFQTNGRGQRGNTWESENGKNILISVLVDVSFLDPEDVHYLTIITAMAIHDTLSEYLPEGLKIKWPNDIYYHHHKISGILIENFIRNNTIQWCIAGAGININQVVFREKNAISLAQICRQPFDREEIILLLLQNLERRYDELKKGHRARLHATYLSKLYWLGELHVFQAGGKFFNGRIESVEKDGKLRIATENGYRLFDLKEVTFVK